MGRGAKKDGMVLCGHCTCKAGLGEVCSHITALLYALESTVRHLGDRSCTDGPRQWGLPLVKAGKDLFEEGSGIDFSYPAKRCSGQHQIIHPSSSHKEKVSISTEATEKFYRDLDNATQNTNGKSGLLRILPQYCHQFQPKVVSLGLPQPLTQLYNAQFRKLSDPELAKKCDAAFGDIKVTPEQVYSFPLTLNDHNLYQCTMLLILCVIGLNVVGSKN